jgi:Domain of unknown function (DUF305)
MTTGIRSENEIALFAHQMIPHHQNAVNMAKTLLISGTIPCDDVTDDEDPLCIMNVIVREIINNQNLVSFFLECTLGDMRSLPLIPPNAAKKV